MLLEDGLLIRGLLKSRYRGSLQIEAITFKRQGLAKIVDSETPFDAFLTFLRYEANQLQVAYQSFGRRKRNPCHRNKIVSESGQ